MATKEDILEQIVEDYLLHEGFFVRHNDKYRPNPNDPEFVKKNDCVNSDIDIVAIHPLRSPPDNIFIVNCKSWQGGFRPSQWIDAIENDKKVSGRLAWKAFRELASDKWSRAFHARVFELTGSERFTYITAVTRLDGDPSTWESFQPFVDRMAGNPIRVLPLSQMVKEILPKLNKTVAATHVGRLLQLLKASGVKSI